MKNEINGIKNELHATSNTGEVNKKKAKMLVEIKNNGISEKTLVEIIELIFDLLSSKDCNDLKKYVDLKILEIEEKLNTSDYQNIDEDKFISILKKEKVKPPEFKRIINREIKNSWWVENYPETLSFIRNNGGLVKNLTSTKDKPERVVVTPSDKQMAIVLSLQETDEVEINRLIQEIDEFVGLFPKEEWNKVYSCIVDIITIVKDNNMSNDRSFSDGDRDGEMVLTWFKNNKKDTLSFISQIGIIKYHSTYHGEYYSLLLDIKNTLKLLNILNEKIESELEK